MVFPEIDCLGSYITGNTESTVLNIKTYLSVVMSQIDGNYAKYAGFIAKVYRNGLLHQHAPKCFRYKKRQIGWAFQVGSADLPITALRNSHLRFVRNNLWIHTNVFYDDILKSFDVAVPIITNNYQREFSKSFKKQYKNLFMTSCVKTVRALNKRDFNFLKELK